VDDTLIRAEPLFTRVTIMPIESTDLELRQWWFWTRGFYNGWMPPENVRTFLLFEEGPNYASFFKSVGDKGKAAEYEEVYSMGGDIVIAYVDDEGRLIRAEQIGGIYCTAAELKKIGGASTWWGKKD
jgi:hypothetical protein